MTSKSAVLDRVFHALADPTRRAILAKVSEKEYTITELAEPYKMTFAAVSKHIRVLESAGLLKREKDGRIYRCSGDLENLKDASEFIDKYKRFWEKQFDVLEKYLKNYGEKK